MKLPFVKKPILWLIVFMSISLIGIILVQLFWIKQAIEVQKAQITSDIFDALRTSVIRIEKENRTHAFLKSRGYNPKHFRKRFNNKTTKPYTSQRSFSEGGTEITLNTEIVWQDKGLNGEPQSNEPMKEEFSKLSIVGESPEEQEKLLIDWFNQMSREMSALSNSLHGRLTTEQLEDVLNEEFTERGLPKKYEYGIVDKSKLEVTSFHSSNFNPAEQFNCYTIPLFPMDMFRGASPYYLQVNFHNLTPVIFSSIGWLMGASLIFTLFILFAFFLTTKTIVSQKRVSEIKNDFINNMTHEFKTPIATISLATDSISNPNIISSPDRITPLLSIIKEENKRMNKHVERILQLSLLEKKNIQLYKTETDIHALILKVVEKMNLIAKQSGGEIKTTLTLANPLIYVDEVHFTNAIQNLIDNAIKYTDKPPIIEISTQKIDNKISISVKDNGIGLSKDQQDRIFEKFYRVHTGNQHNVKGFGLGLNYVKTIVALHNGSISLQSKPSFGSIFTIFIPQSSNNQML